MPSVLRNCTPKNTSSPSFLLKSGCKPRNKHFVVCFVFGFRIVYESVCHIGNDCVAQCGAGNKAKNNINNQSLPILLDWRVPESNRHFPNSPYKARDRFERPSVGWKRESQLVTYRAIKKRPWIAPWPLQIIYGTILSQIFGSGVSSLRENP